MSNLGCSFLYMYLALVLLLKTVLGLHVFALAWGRSVTEKSFVYRVVILQKLALKKKMNFVIL